MGSRLRACVAALLVTAACGSPPAGDPRVPAEASGQVAIAEPTPGAPAAADEEGESSVPDSDERLQAFRAARQDEREAMVREQLVPRGIRDAGVLAAMRSVPREAFVPDEVKQLAYADDPLPIGFDVTISQPAIVAGMTELARVEPGSRVLEIGTGSGYQAAVLAEMGARVYSIEIIEPLAARAKATLERLGYGEIELRTGDGYRGWPEEAPFDAIIVTAAPPRVPEPLKQQLAVGGRLVIPVGRNWQDLLVITRTHDGFREHNAYPVRFVPMTGEAADESR